MACQRRGPCQRAPAAALSGAALKRPAPSRAPPRLQDFNDGLAAVQSKWAEQCGALNCLNLTDVAPSLRNGLAGEPRWQAGWTLDQTD